MPAVSTYVANWLTREQSRGGEATGRNACVT